MCENTEICIAMGQTRPGRSARIIARQHNHQITRPSSSAPSSQGSQALKLYEGNSHGRAMPMLLTSTPPGRVIGLLDSGGITDSTAVYQKMICTASGVLRSSST